MNEGDLARAIDDALAEADSTGWLSNTVSVRHRYVAFTAAKAACSTIKLALHRFETPQIPLENWWDVHRSTPGTALAELPHDQIVEVLSSSEWFRFCVVRNPYDRLASAWKQKLRPDGDAGYFWLQDEVRAFVDAPAGRHVTFREAVEYLLAGHEKMTRDPHWRPMTSVMRPDVVAYDVVGRFETFPTDFRAILERIGAPPDVVDIADVVTNATPPMPLSKVYDAELAARVYAHYEADFDAFGYAADSWRDS